MSKKFELTSETKVVFGRRLFRIRALIDVCYGVKKGDLGGWVEKEENLSQVFGEAWVFGEAQVFDKAQVSDKARVFGEAQVSPIYIAIGGEYGITVADKTIRVGCRNFTPAQLRKMKMNDFNNAMEKGWEKWKLYRPIILAAVDIQKEKLKGMNND